MFHYVAAEPRTNLSFASREAIPFEGFSTHILKCESQGIDFKLILNQLAYVPKLKSHLLSLGVTSALGHRSVPDKTGTRICFGDTDWRGGFGVYTGR